MVKMTKKLDEISFDEMQEVADAGAKVLHNRCIEIGKRFDCDIIAKSTFSNQGGTKICKKIEISEVKSIVKNENLVQIYMQNNKKIKESEIIEIYQELLSRNIIVEMFRKGEDNKQIQFRIKKAEQNKVQELLEVNYPNYEVIQKNIVKLSIIGYGITQDNVVLNKVIDILKRYNIEIKDINLTQSKIEIVVDNLENNIVEELHKTLI